MIAPPPLTEPTGGPWRGHPLFSLESLYRAYRRCRRRKRHTHADFKRLPPHKTLFKAQPGCGLPIGNLTSQFFANVYLDLLR
jgi:hypothetical protein